MICDMITLVFTKIEFLLISDKLGISIEVEPENTRIYNYFNI